jgi:integrase
VTTIAHRDHRPAHPWDEVRVLREYPLRDGHTLAATSRFTDDVWQLGPALHQRHTRNLILDFTTLPHRYRTFAKELNCAFMAMPLPPGEQRPTLSTIRSHFSDLKRLYCWLADERGGPALAELTAADTAAYSRFVRGAIANHWGQTMAFAAVRRIWRFRTTLPGDRLMFDPHRAGDWSQERPQAGENSTDRIPEQVLGPLIVWATRFVDLFADDIIATTHEWEQLRRNTATLTPGGRTSRPDLLPALEKLLARHLEENRPLPGHKGKINHAFLGGVLSCHRGAFRRNAAYRDRVEAAAEIVGIGETTDYYTPITALLDGEPWLRKVSTDYGDTNLGNLARLLQTSCYILIAFYSGMRDSETKHLRRDCLRIERDAEGTPYRWKLNSRAFKGEGDLTGVEATWTAGAPAARAIKVLDRLQPQHAEFLFQSLPYGAGWAADGIGRSLTSSATSQALNRFVKWINAYCADRERADVIPDVDGKPFHLTTRQFRRTLAWFIARRPGGVIAGALAYRHLSIQMFEGYAGTSDSGFRAEVESEQALTRGEQLIDLTDTHRHRLQGPGAEEAILRLDKLGLNADGFGGNVLTDQRRLLRLMKRHDPAIYPGTYVTCVYRHDKALCRPRNDSSGQVLPELADCKPLKCKNVALAGENITAWRAESDRIDEHLARRPRLPPVLEQQLRQRQDQIHDFLARHVEQEPSR